MGGARALASSSMISRPCSSKKMSGVRSLRNELREFVLENVELFDDERVLGTGSYGSVQEVTLYRHS